MKSLASRVTSENNLSYHQTHTSMKSQATSYPYPKSVIFRMTVIFYSAPIRLEVWTDDIYSTDIEHIIASNVDVEDCNIIVKLILWHEEHKW